MIDWIDIHTWPDLHKQIMMCGDFNGNTFDLIDCECFRRSTIPSKCTSLEKCWMRTAYLRFDEHNDLDGNRYTNASAIYWTFCHRLLHEQFVPIMQIYRLHAWCRPDYQNTMGQSYRGHFVHFSAWKFVTNNTRFTCITIQSTLCWNIRHLHFLQFFLAKRCTVGRTHRTQTHTVNTKLNHWWFKIELEQRVPSHSANGKLALETENIAKQTGNRFVSPRLAMTIFSRNE